MAANGKFLKSRLKKYSFVIHPVLFALFPLLSFYGANASEIRSGNFSLTTFFVFNLAALGVLWLMALIATRNLKRSSVLVVVMLIVFFMFGRVHGYAQNAFPDTSDWVFGLTKTLFLLSAGLVGAVWLWLRKLSDKTITKCNTTLAMIAAVLVGSTFISIIPPYLSKDSTKTPASTNDIQANPALSPDELPDVYYILLDGYARADFLKDKFNFDNSSFIAGLRDRGFYVADEANSNYAHTHFSVPSTFNMKYLNYLVDEMGEDSTDRRPLRELTQNNEVISTFKDLGYKYVNIGSHWGWTESNPHADITVKAKNNADSKILGIELDEFALVYLQTTAIKPWVSTEIRGGLLSKILGAFEKTEEVPAINEPTLTFTHLVSPHPPYLFDRNGVVTGHTDLELLNDGFSNRKGFSDQTYYVNKLMLELIDKIQKNSDKPPIIIVASDHGPASGLNRSDFSVTDPAQLNEEGIRERMGILNAYYFPGEKYDSLYPSISPVNSFRVVLNQYFGQNLELLPDKSYFSNNKANEYRMLDVTDLVKSTR